MQIAPFQVERYFALHEFKAKYLLCCSDCQALTLTEVLAMADQECLDLWANLSLCYTESKGHPLLIQEIIKSYNNQDVDVLEVIPEEGIFLIMHTILQKGDHVIVIDPSYQSLSEIAISIGCDVQRWTIKEQDNQYKLDLEQLIQMIKKETKLIIINFPHNPTGFIPSLQDFIKIVDICKQNNIILFSDEMYRGLELEKNDQLPSACEVYDRAIVLSGMSKVYSMPGIRVGWLATQQKDLIKEINKNKDYTTICGSSTSEILALIGLRNRFKISQQNLDIIKQNINSFKQFLDLHQDKFQFIYPQGGSIGFVKLIPEYYQSAQQFVQNLLEKHNILLIEGQLFNQQDDLHFRIGFGRLNFHEILLQLSEILLKGL